MEDLATYGFAELTAPPIVTICGVELHPFCLGHWQHLEKIKSPFLPDSTNPDITPQDFILFVMICGMSFEDGHASLNDYQAFLEMKGIVERHIHANMLFGKWVVLNRLACFKVNGRLPFNRLLKKLFGFLLVDRHWNLRQELANVSDYLQYYLTMPSFTTTRDESIPSGVPWRHQIFSVLKNEYGYDESSIMNMPLRRVFSEWCIYSEKNGSIRVDNIYDIKNQELAAKIKADIIKQNADKLNKT